jgi:hypothetical protein
MTASDSFAPFWLCLDVRFVPNNDRTTVIRKRLKRAKFRLVRCSKAASFADLAGAGEQLQRNFKPERFGSPTMVTQAGGYAAYIPLRAHSVAAAAKRRRPPAGQEPQRFAEYLHA